MSDTGLIINLSKRLYPFEKFRHSYSLIFINFEIGFN